LDLERCLIVAAVLSGDILGLPAQAKSLESVSVMLTRLFGAITRLGCQLKSPWKSVLKIQHEILVDKARHLAFVPVRTRSVASIA
jgi:hypothetical protein